MTAQLPTNKLYDQDYCLWIEKTVDLLRKRQFSEIDFDNLIEELEGMSRSEKTALESNLEVVLMHLLKYKYQPGKRTRSWLLTLFEHRNRLNKACKNSPSLKPYLTKVFDECYQTARKKASLETGFPLEIFPVDCPFTPEETLNFDYLPD
jgi:hypothetical protein